MSARLDRPGGPSPLIVASVVGCALAGASAVLLSTRYGESTSLAIAAVPAAVAGLVYPFRGRMAAYTLTVTGSAITTASVFGLATGYMAPWLLVAFWGGASVLLSGLIHFTSATEDDALAGVTVAAILTLLLLSGVAIGQYVRAQTRPASVRTEAGSVLEPS